jgi:hypothetical protein
MQIDEDTFVVNSAMSFKAFCAWVWTKFLEHKFLTFEFRIGPDRSLDQNALLHVWLTLYAAHLAGIARKAVTKGMVEFLKRRAKKEFYAETRFVWMLDKLVNPESGEEGTEYFRSSADYKRGEMFLFLTWLQSVAAHDGLVLESKGEYAKLQRQREAA